MADQNPVMVVVEDISKSGTECLKICELYVGHDKFKCQKDCNKLINVQLNNLLAICKIGSILNKMDANKVAK